MTNDKAVYTVEFKDDVSLGAQTIIEEETDPEVLTVETEVKENILTVTVWGDSNAIPVWEENWSDTLFDLYPSAEITNVESYPGQGTERQES